MPFDLKAFRDHHSAVLSDDPEAAVSVKAATLKSPAIDRKERLVKGLVSTVAVDNDREVVVPEGFDFSYFPMAVKAVYLNHDYKSLPVGTCVNLAVKSGALYASTYVTKRSIGDDLLTAMEEGAVNGFSVGFKVREGGPPSEQERTKYGACEFVVRRALLVEYSITPMPCNPQALVELVSKSAIHRSSAVAFGLPDTAERKVWGVRPERRVWARKAS